MTSDAHRFEREIPTSLKDAYDLHMEIYAWIVDTDCTENELFKVRLVLEESLMNAVKHGNRFNQNLKIQATVVVSNDAIQIVVVDEGAGFDPSYVPDPLCAENLEKSSGRGLMLINTYMHEIRFNDVGNRIEMILRRDG